MKMFLLSLLLCLPACGKDQRFAWDANSPAETVDGYTLWLHRVTVPPTPEPVFTESISTNATALTATIPGMAPGKYEVYLTAFILDGIPRHSDPSNIVAFTIPSPPAGLRVVLEASEDMQTWLEVASWQEPEVADRKYYRIAFAPVP